MELISMRGLVLLDQGLFFIGGESVSYNHPLLVAVQTEWLARLLKVRGHHCLAKKVCAIVFG